MIESSADGPISAGCSLQEIASRFSQNEAYCQHERGEIDATAYFASLRRSLGLGLTDEQFLDGWNDLYPGPCEGIEGLLARAERSLPLFAFTNSNPSHQSVWSTVLDQELRHFRRVFVSSEIGVRKPEPEAFRLVANEAGYPPDRMLFFDDALVNVEGARHAGMQAVHVRSILDVRDVLGALGLHDDAAESSPAP